MLVLPLSTVDWAQINNSNRISVNVSVKCANACEWEILRCTTAVNHETKVVWPFHALEYVAALLAGRLRR